MPENEQQTSGDESGAEAAPPAASSEVRLNREMRLVDITMIGVGAMIGAGIFVLTGIAAGVFGTARGFETARPFAAYWAAIAMVCMVEAFLLIRRQAIREVEPFWTPPTRRIAQAVAPAFFAGLVMGRRKR